MAAIGKKQPAERPASDSGNHVPNLRRVHHFRAQAVTQRYVPLRVEVVHLRFGNGDLESALLRELGGIAQLLVQCRPYPYGFHGHRYQRRFVDPLADHPAVAPRGFAPDDPLVDDHDIPARPGQKIR